MKYIKHIYEGFNNDDIIKIVEDYLSHNNSQTHTLKPIILLDFKNLDDHKLISKIRNMLNSISNYRFKGINIIDGEICDVPKTPKDSYYIVYTVGFLKGNPMFSEQDLENGLNMIRSLNNKNITIINY